MKKALIKKLALVLALSLGLTACSAPAQSTSGNAPSNPPAQSQAPAQGGTAAPTQSNPPQQPVKITIWYEGNDSRLPYFKAVEAEMQKEYPNISIETVTFDNATLMTKALQAITTTGGVDLVFNSASRLLQLYQQSNKGFEELNQVLDTAVNKEVMTDADLKLSSSEDKLIVLPINRSLAGLGVKTDVAGVDVNDSTLPSTWDKFLALGKSYKAAGKAGFTMHLGVDPGQVFNLFMVGSGMDNIWIDGAPESQIKNKLESFKKVVEVYAGADGIWDKDATTEDFAAMYTKIQSGSVGMFRVGDWNVANWDKPDSGVGSFTVTTWPSMDGSGKGALVNTNTRGLALPKNAPNKEAAKIYLKYALSKPAQEKSFETMGSCIDLSVVNTDKLSPNQKIFFDPSVQICAFDAYVGQFEYYPALLEVYEKGLIKAFNSKSAEEITKNLEQLDADLAKAIKENK